MPRSKTPDSALLGRVAAIMADHKPRVWIDVSRALNTPTNAKGYITKSAVIYTPKQVKDALQHLTSFGLLTAKKKHDSEGDRTEYEAKKGLRLADNGVDIQGDMS